MIPCHRGPHPRPINSQSRREFLGRHIYCACDANFTRAWRGSLWWAGDSCGGRPCIGGTQKVTVIHHGTNCGGRFHPGRKRSERKLHFMWNSVIGRVTGSDIWTTWWCGILKTGELAEVLADPEGTGCSAFSASSTICPTRSCLRMRVFVRWRTVTSAHGRTRTNSFPASPTQPGICGVKSLRRSSHHPAADEPCGQPGGALCRAGIARHMTKSTRMTLSIREYWHNTDSNRDLHEAVRIRKEDATVVDLTKKTLMMRKC